LIIRLPALMISLPILDPKYSFLAPSRRVLILLPLSLIQVLDHAPAAVVISCVVL